MPITIRNIKKEKDLEKFVKFLNLAHADYPGHQDISKEYVQNYIFKDKDFDEKLNFLAFDGDRLVGRGRGDYETETDGSVTLQMIPEYRSDELRKILYDVVLESLAKKELKTIRAMSYSIFSDQINFFRARNFQDKFNFFTMIRDMSQPIQKIEIPNVIFSVPDMKKEYKTVRDTIENGFSDTMDSGIEEMMVNFDEFAREDWFLKDGIIVAKDENENMLGVCVAAIHPAMKDKGHIPWLAVLKEHRRKGIGRALLLSSLGWLDKNKTKDTTLSVEIDNPNALKLYQDCGFETRSELIIMEKKL